MILYHGTAKRHLPGITQHGVRPRGKAAGNWKATIRSNPKAVYLTDAYALHFARAATKDREPYAVLEIDTDGLDVFRFAPDEDFLEQATRNDESGDIHGLSMLKRTMWFRKRAHTDFWHLWEQSLKGMGTCTYYGDIPAGNIRRYALVAPNCEASWHMDPTITTINYLIKGSFYRALSQKLFDGKIEQGDLSEHDQKLIDDLSPKGIAVHDFPGKEVSDDGTRTQGMAGA